MPIIVKAKKNQSTNDVIRAFKKAAANAEIVDKAKDRRYHSRPSQIRAQKTAETKRTRRRILSAKRNKSIQQRSAFRQGLKKN